ncbi:MBL fold metallo-hydrolase [Microbaculum marinum]|uniref:MBL fold metallo-hydrolase n=1 Tax=Microbaculum marinum TaxID=1764581 RepID=A0AAW9RTU3_9HYPH
MGSAPIEQVAGLYHRRIGDVTVTALSDGYLDAPFEVLRDIEPADADSLLKGAYRPSPPRISVNCFLIQTGERVGLVDTGSGETMGPTLGRLPGLLARMDLTLADVDTVLLTHMHPDHSNGLTAEDGTALFPNAELVVSEQEIGHWYDDAAMARATESQKTRYFGWGRFQTGPYRDRVRHAAGEVLPNVTAVPLAGHTPGHTGYQVASGDDALLIWGDIVHVPDIQSRHPEVTMVFDSDPEQAVATRRRMFDMAASDGLLVAGMHVHYPAFAHVVRRGDAYALEPEVWAFTM